MTRAAVLIAAALLLAGCGGTSAGNAARPRVSNLCVDVGLPLSGPDAAAGAGVLAGVKLQIPATGVRIGEYRLDLCHVRNDTPVGRREDAAVLANTRAADGGLRTIAYIGELSGADAQTAETVLAQAGIPLLTPSGPTATPYLSATIGPMPVPVRNTALYLLPAASTQADAVRSAKSDGGCVTRRRQRPTCTVLGPAAAPLCTGIPAAPSTSRRLCVMAGPDLTSWPSPATAYGSSAAALLLSSLKAIEAGGGDVADRATVLGTLRHRLTKSSPIGPIRFDGAGAIKADDFSVYTVEADGALALSHEFSTH